MKNIILILLLAALITSCTRHEPDYSAAAIKNYNLGNEKFDKRQWVKAIGHYAQIQMTDTLYDSSRARIEVCRTHIEFELAAGTSELSSITPKKDTTWQEKFIDYRMKYNSDLKKLIIDESVLYIYVARITRDVDAYSTMYTMKFQQEYQKNTGLNRVTSLVYYNGRLINTIEADRDGVR